MLLVIMSAKQMLHHCGTHNSSKNSILGNTAISKCTLLKCFYMCNLSFLLLETFTMRFPCSGGNTLWCTFTPFTVTSGISLHYNLTFTNSAWWSLVKHLLLISCQRQILKQLILKTRSRQIYNNIKVLECL